MKDLILKELNEARNVIDNFIADEVTINAINEAAEIMIECIRNEGKIISCGNGGSMSDAMHFAEELTGKFRDERSPIPAISISDPSHITCVGNDYGFDAIFSRYIESIGKNGDILLAISTSGNSANVIRAAEEANKKKIQERFAQTNLDELIDLDKKNASSLVKAICTPPFLLKEFLKYPAPRPPACICDLIAHGPGPSSVILSSNLFKLLIKILPLSTGRSNFFKSSFDWYS